MRRFQAFLNFPDIRCWQIGSQLLRSWYFYLFFYLFFRRILSVDRRADTDGNIGLVSQLTK